MGKSHGKPHEKPQETQQGKPHVKGTETLILQAAEREFMAKGFAGARTTSIAESAGVTHAMFHYYFRTKEKLFERIISEELTLLKDAVIGSIKDVTAPLDVILKDIISNHLEFIAANPGLPRFIVGEMFRVPERFTTFLGKIHEITPSFIAFIQDKINKEADAGRCRRVDATMLILDVVALNIFPYMASPIVGAALGNCMDNAEEFLARRKQENYDTIMRKIKL